MTRQEYMKHIKRLEELQKDLHKGAHTVAELMQREEAQAYITAVKLVNELYKLMPPWED